MKELVSTIQSLLSKVEEGNITQTEMEQLVADARELNERLIVLRYKVYEQGIFEVPSINEKEVEVELPEIDINLEITDEPQAEIANEADESTISEEFDEDHALSEVMNSMLNDLSNDDIESINTSLTDNTVENSSTNSDLFSSEEPTSEPALDLNFEEEEELEQEETEDEEIIEENTIISSSFDDESNSETQEITHHQTSVIETEESTTIIEREETTTITTFENPIEETETPQAELPSSSGDSETENKLKTIEKSLRINYSIVPLETLIGSFTLNERLQFINELFEGSSDSFSTAVKKLDGLDGLDSARMVVGEFASTNNWDLDSEIVEDFLVKICRRYA